MLFALDAEQLAAKLEAEVPRLMKAEHVPGLSMVLIRDGAGHLFTYSGEGYLYLQTVIERLTRQPVAAWMEASLLAPLNMTRRPVAGFAEIQLCRGTWQKGQFQDGATVLSTR
jgi:CubicO group peptidase (beta-lactamase class C family)